MITYILVNNLGGITSLIRNLILFTLKDHPNQKLLFLDVLGNKNSVVNGKLLEEVEQEVVHFDKDANWYSQFKHLKQKIGSEKGIIVSNDQFDLIMLQAFNLNSYVVQIVHDEYNLKLAKKFHQVVDKFIAHSNYFYERLKEDLRDRQDDIVYIPYGIPISGKLRKCNLEKELKLIFLGRLTRTKGIFDLKIINDEIQKKGVSVNWRVIGRGPDAQSLKDEWAGANNIEFFEPDGYEELTDLLVDGDVFVFPTKFEGFPVALLETMSVGLVPVATDLPGGLNELIDDEVGFKCPLDDNSAFVSSILKLNTDRMLLESMSAKAAKLVKERHLAEIQSPIYLRFFEKVNNLNVVPKHHFVSNKIGSRLDQPWLPNFITRSIRKVLHK